MTESRSTKPSRGTVGAPTRPRPVRRLLRAAQGFFARSQLGPVSNYCPGEPHVSS